MVLDVETGEVLAMVNQPTFNPNSRVGISPTLHRNRAVTDVLEPGSTMKPFTVAAALEDGVDPNIADQHQPGWLSHRQAAAITDTHNYGVLDMHRHDRQELERRRREAGRQA